MMRNGSTACATPRDMTALSPDGAGYSEISVSIARTAAAKCSWFKELEAAMRIRGLSDEQIESYFSDTISKDEMLTYLEGSEQQGYRRGFKEGKDKWLAEGRTEGKAEVAKAMLLNGMPVDQIMLFTGLSAVQIQALR